MKLYADSPARMLRQLLGDVLFVAWLVCWVWAGLAVHDATLELAGPGDRIAESASGISDAMSDAGGVLADVPLVGEDARAPFDRASEGADRLADAGRAEVRAVERLAWWLGWAVAAVPILVVGLVHVPRRVRFVRRATAGATFVDAAEDLDLFALRALAHQPLHVLAGISDDPAGDWRARDARVVDRLAALELRAEGLRLPAGRRAH